MFAVMLILGKAKTWPVVKETLWDDDLIHNLLAFTVDDMSPELLQKVQKYTTAKDFDIGIIQK